MQLRISGISLETKEDELIKLFSAISAVESVRIIRDISTGVSRGFGTVKISNSKHGREVIQKLDGAILGGQKIHVSKMPDTLPGELEFREWLIDNTGEILLQAGIGSGMTILDFGCGPGIFTIPIAKLTGDGGKVYALDVRPDVLERVRIKAEEAGLDNIVTIFSDSLALGISLEDESVDAVVVYDVLHEIKDCWRLFQDFYRILKPEGVLSIFPMHIGTDKMLEIMNERDLFRLDKRIGLKGYNTASEIMNFKKYTQFNLT